MVDRSFRVDDSVGKGMPVRMLDASIRMWPGMRRHRMIPSCCYLNGLAEPTLERRGVGALGIPDRLPTYSLLHYEISVNWRDTLGKRTSQGYGDHNTGYILHHFAGWFETLTTTMRRAHLASQRGCCVLCRLGPTRLV